MTSLEFDEWLTHHCRAFPMIGDWLTDQGEETSVLWLKVMRKVRLKAAKDATLEMLGDEDLQPKGFSQHPARIVKLAKAKNGLEATPGQQGNRYISGELTYVCGVCLDSGTLLVFLPEAMRAMRDGHFGWKHKHMTGAVSCSCAIGQRMTKITAYDSRRMVLAQVPSDTAFALGIERLAAFFGVPVPEIAQPVHVRPQVEAPPPLPEGVRLVGSLLPSSLPSAAPPARVSEPFHVDEANAAFAEAEGPWHPDMDLPY